jgi:signal transduction histidine kinase
MQSYARLVRLPPPRVGKVDVAQWAQRTADLASTASPTRDGGSKAASSRVDVPRTDIPRPDAPRVVVDGGPSITIPGDADQLDQLLINLVRNALEANSETQGSVVKLSWSVASGAVVLAVEDEGPGVADTSNLFVPFFTTKPQGSGIGLVLARQIAEAHGGSLVLRNRKTGRGAEAIVTLPTAAVAARAS